MVLVLMMTQISGRGDLQTIGRPPQILILLENILRRRRRSCLGISLWGERPKKSQDVRLILSRPGIKPPVEMRRYPSGAYPAREKEAIEKYLLQIMQRTT
jgi:hypothetical protein